MHLSAGYAPRQHPATIVENAKALVLGTRQMRKNTRKRLIEHDVDTNKHELKSFGRFWYQEIRVFLNSKRTVRKSLSIKNPAKDFCSGDLCVRPSVWWWCVSGKWLVGPCRTSNRATSFFI